jgi:phasin
MAEDDVLKAEVPDSIRNLMKLSIEQARQAFETFAAASEKAWKSLEARSQAAGTTLQSLNEKLAEITRINAEANFALAIKLAESKDLGQAMELQAEHMRKQVQRSARQLEEIRDLATKIIQESSTARS